MDSVRKILDLFSAREKWRLSAILGGVFVMALLETFAVGSIMPFMGLVADPGLIDSNPALMWLFERFGGDDPSGFLLVVGSAVLSIIVVSNTFSAFMTWVIYRFTWQKNHDLAVSLLEKYLHQPYLYFVSHNTADLNKNILSQVIEVVRGVLVPGILALSKAVLAFFLFGLLLAMNVGLALTAGAVLGGAYSAIYYIARRRQTEAGEVQIVENASRFRTSAEALQGIKEIKVLGREREFLERFAKPSLAFSRVSATGEIVPNLPRFAMEIIAFGGILLILLILMAAEQDLGRVLPLVSLYAFAGYKLLPALQQLFHSFTAIRFFTPALNELHADLFEEGRRGERAMGPQRRAPEAERSHEEAQPSGHDKIALERVSYRYPGAENEALAGVSFEIVRNATIGLAGTTGSGKTTLVDVILGLLEPTGGRITVDGQPLGAEAWRQWSRQFGYVPQEIFLADGSIARNIALGLSDEVADRDAVLRASRIAQLHDFVESLPDGYDTPVGERGVRLSGGQRQRIGIARALYRDPPILLLDEATSALDGVTEDEVMAAIRALQSEKTMLLVAHRLSTLQHCDVIHVLDGGKIVASGSYDQLLRENETFRSMAKVSSE